MKLSIATYRASRERLNNLRQNYYGSTSCTDGRRGSSLDSGAARLLDSGGSSDEGESKHLKAIKQFSEQRSTTSFSLTQPGEGKHLTFSLPVAAMMVDGSPRRASGVQVEAVSKSNENIVESIKPSGPKEGAVGEKTTASAKEGNTTLSNRNVTSRSRWLKLRTTVQLSGAITHIQKKPPLKREDSFLKRFSTRQFPDSLSGDGSASYNNDNQYERWKGLQCLRVLLHVINPDENLLFGWLWLLTGCVLYNAWTLIVRQAFPELHRAAASFWFTADGFSDLVYLIDIAVQFRTGYLEQGLMVVDAKKLALHYVRSRHFLIDLAAIVPLDLVQLHVGTIPLLRFPRFSKVYRSYRFYYMVESRTIYPNLWRVVNLIHILLLLAHWFGCFYYMLSEFEGFQGEWVYPKPEGDYATLTRKYLGSVYWSTLTLTTIGDLATPASNLQYIFTIVSYLIGVFIFATIVGQVGNVITNRNANRLEFERLLDGAKLYMRHHKVPHGMQRRVQRWYDYSWSRGRMQGGGDINSALGLLPDKLKTELALHVNLKTLKKVSIFQECQPEFLHDLVLKMRAYIFTPGDLICRKGEVAREMFIIADGILEVISETGTVLTRMNAGDFFGEIGILNLDGFNRRTADVRSVGYSELFSLSREDVLSAMKDYPEAQDILQTMGKKRLMEARRATTTGKKSDGEESVRSTTPRSAALVDEERPCSTTNINKTGSTLRLFKRDMKSLKKLLRSKSSPGGTCKSTDCQLEMATLPGGGRMSSKSGGEGQRHSCPGQEINNSPIQKLFRKLHQNSDVSGRQRIKGLARRISCVKAQMSEGAARSGANINHRSPQPALSLSTQATNYRPLGEGLPLLERLKLLKEKERAMNDKLVIGKIVAVPSMKVEPISSEPCRPLKENLPLIERIKLLKEKEKATSQSATLDQSSIATNIEMQPQNSQTSQENDCSQVIGEGLPLLERLKLLREKEKKQDFAPQGSSSMVKIKSFTSTAKDSINLKKNMGNELNFQSSDININQEDTSLSNKPLKTDKNETKVQIHSTTDSVKHFDSSYPCQSLFNKESDRKEYTTDDKNYGRNECTKTAFSSSTIFPKWKITLQKPAKEALLPQDTTLSLNMSNHHMESTVRAVETVNFMVQSDVNSGYNILPARLREPGELVESQAYNEFNNVLPDVVGASRKIAFPVRPGEPLCLGNMEVVGDRLNCTTRYSNYGDVNRAVSTSIPEANVSSCQTATEVELGEVPILDTLQVTEKVWSRSTEHSQDGKGDIFQTFSRSFPQSTSKPKTAPLDPPWNPNGMEKSKTSLSHVNLESQKPIFTLSNFFEDTSVGQLSTNKPRVVSEYRQKHHSRKPRELLKYVPLSPELLRAETVLGHAARRTRLVRMEAFQEESTEELSSEEFAPGPSSPTKRDVGCQTFVNTKDAQTEVCVESVPKPAETAVRELQLDDTALGTGPVTNTYNCSARFELEDRLQQLLSEVTESLKFYFEQNQQVFKTRIEQLQDELRQRNGYIDELHHALRTAHSPEPFRSPMKESCLQEKIDYSDSTLSTESGDEELPFMMEKSFESVLEQPSKHSEDINRAKLKDQRFSWPLEGGSDKNSQDMPRRSSLDHHKKEFGDNNEQEPLLNPDELWKVEFPVKNNVHVQPSSTSTRRHSVLPCSVDHQMELYPDSKYSDSLHDKTPNNDWEVRMLVEEFEKKVQEQQKRRHSSGEMLSWKRVLGADFHNHKQPFFHPGGQDRKLSLRDDWLHQYSCSSRHKKSYPRVSVSDYLLHDRLNSGSRKTTSASMYDITSIPLPKGKLRSFEVKQGSRCFPRPTKTASYRRQLFRQNKQHSMTDQSSPLQNRHNLSRWVSLDDSSCPQDYENTLGRVRSELLPKYVDTEDAHWKFQNSDTRVLIKPPVLPSERFLSAGLKTREFTGWPSSPCLPTITEIDHQKLVLSKQDSYGLNRSASEDYLNESGGRIAKDSQKEIVQRENLEVITVKDQTNCLGTESHTNTDISGLKGACAVTVESYQDSTRSECEGSSLVPEEESFIIPIPEHQLYP